MDTIATEPSTEAADDFRPFRMTNDRYGRLALSGVYPTRDAILLRDGRLVEKIERDILARPDGDTPEHLMTVDRFLQLIEAGVFTSQDDVFLWHGRLVEKRTVGRPHTITQLGLQSLLVAVVSGHYHVELEAPLEIGPESLPEPDLAVIRGSLRDYPDRPPTAGNVSLIIEVADSSVAVDSGRKLRDYAAEGIPVYWIVNIPQTRMEVYSQPEGITYQDRRDYGPDDDVPVLLDGQEVGRIAVKEILP
jgi:Uma2 family endonuclease